jgi:CheY-like chemotaxis protein
MDEDRVAGKRILLVEDQQGVREAMRFLLVTDHHVVTEARNGLEALKLFVPGLFDLVITDYAMPGMAGNELAMKIKLKAPSQPVLMVTAYAENLVGSENPVDAMLSKPFSSSDWRASIAELLGLAAGAERQKRQVKERD